jgi:hypothetical protein
MLHEPVGAHEAEGIPHSGDVEGGTERMQQGDGEA